VIEIQDRLVFDSWNSAVPDLRGSSGDERHLIYEGAGIVLDLLLKPATEGSCLQIGGQVLPTDDLSQSVAHVAVLLENGGASARTHTNALGEFSFQYAPENGCFDISIVFGARKLVVRGLDSTEPRNWQVVTSGSGQKLAEGGTQ
jgi:hypothetical protein